MRIRSAVFLGLFLVGLASGGEPRAGMAQDAIDPDVIKAQTGNWMVGAQNGKPGCVLSLTGHETIGGFAVEHADACATSIEKLSEVSAWNFDGDGGIVLIDPLRKVKARFASSEGTALTETAGDSDPLLMVPAITGLNHFPAAGDLKGKWVMNRPAGDTLCTVDLDDKRDENENFELTLSKDCKPDVKKLKFETWTLEGFNLILLGSDGTSLDFQMTANGFEKNKAERGKPLLLVRP